MSDFPFAMLLGILFMNRYYSLVPKHQFLLSYDPFIPDATGRSGKTFSVAHPNYTGKGSTYYGFHKMYTSRRLLPE